ncbi:MAG: 4-(cytidine 5'-diphospho)-2-C-methyl-D-erythritol kinase [Candidatus Paracaedibacter sp.]
MTITRLAPAKINLMLHVVERLADGYHHLQSLVAFASISDQITIEKADNSSLTVDGPFAENVPLGPENSVILAAQWLGKMYPNIGQIHIHLTKNLPVSSGIGGGTSDAAATIAALLEYHQVSLSLAEEDKLILHSGALGADVPLCLAYQFGRGPLLWVNGSGRNSLPLPVNQKLPGVLLLVNPGTPMSTPAIFKEIQPPYTASQDLEKIVESDFHGDILDYLKTQTNDLMPAAITQEPVISSLLEAFQGAPGCLFARMSGSGTTCFGLFKNEVSAQKAQTFFRKEMSHGWVTLCHVI